jgi:hypothetical protein
MFILDYDYVPTNGIVWTKGPQSMEQKGFKRGICILEVTRSLKWHSKFFYNDFRD